MKQRITFRILMGFALVAVLCLGSAAAAFAAGEPVTGTEDQPAQAAITKVLQMPEGTPTPAASFTFEITAQTVDGAAATATNMPVIGNQTLTFAAGENGTTTDRLKSIYKETADIFAGVTWPHAGEYLYTITEQAGTYSATTGETMTYSGASYNVTVYVANKANNSGLYIAAIGTVINVKDTAAQAGNVGDKVDPTPGGNPDVAGDFSKLIFTNTFLKTNGGPAPTDTVLSISKTVEGAYGDQTRLFPFSLNVAQAATLPAETVYKVYVLDAANAVATSIDNADAVLIKTDDAGKSYIEVTAGTDTTIKLKHGQRLSFTDAHIGTRYTVTETAAAGYTPKVSVVVNGAGAVETIGTLNSALASGPNLIGAAANSADFTNSARAATPTGIALNNLPFIILIALAGGAFAAFVVVKSRKRNASRG